MNTNSQASPTIDEVLFSTKTFAAAMLTLYIALCFDLQNPFWAVTTVYIVANPLSGASTSKAVFRLIGTVIGGVATVILVPNLVNSPELLMLAISLFIGICLSVSLLDRTPRSYVLMLAGYTTALAGFPIVAVPETAFTYASARVIEIGVGIICTALVSRLVFPRHAGSVLSDRMDGWLKGGASLIAGTLDGEFEEAHLSRLVRGLASDAVDFRNLVTHVAYDTSGHRDAVGLTRTLQRRMVEILPVISGLSNGLSAFFEVASDDQAKPMKALIRDVGVWLRSGKQLFEDQRSEFLMSLDNVERHAASGPGDARLLVAYNVARIRDLIQIWADCIDLMQDIVTGSRHELRWHRYGVLPESWPVHRDYGRAIHSGIAATLATMIACIFWIATGWSQGGLAAEMAAVLCCIFSTMDDPAPAMRGFLLSGLLSVITAFCLEFGVFPALHGFVPLAASLGLVLIPSGILMARPKTFISGLAFSMLLPTLLGLQSRLDLNFESFANPNIAILAGFGIAWVTTVIVRSSGTEWSAYRLIRAGWLDIAASARNSGTASFTELPHRMVDRLGLMSPRLAALPVESYVTRIDILKDLRNSFNIAELQRNRLLVSSEEKSAIDEVLAAAAFYYSNRRKDGLLLDVGFPEAVCRAIATVGASDRSAPMESTRLALTGLHYSLVERQQPALSDLGSERPVLQERAA